MNHRKESNVDYREKLSEKNSGELKGIAKELKIKKFW